MQLSTGGVTPGEVAWRRTAAGFIWTNRSACARDGRPQQPRGRSSLLPGSIPRCAHRRRHPGGPSLHQSNMPACHADAVRACALCRAAEEKVGVVGLGHIATLAKEMLSSVAPASSVSSESCTKPVDRWRSRACPQCGAGPPSAQLVPKLAQKRLPSAQPQLKKRWSRRHSSASIVDIFIVVLFLLSVFFLLLGVRSRPHDQH